MKADKIGLNFASILLTQAGEGTAAIKELVGPNIRPQSQPVLIISIDLDTITVQFQKSLADGELTN